MSWRGSEGELRASFYHLESSQILTDPRRDAEEQPYSLGQIGRDLGRLWLPLQPRR